MAKYPHVSRAKKDNINPEHYKKLINEGKSETIEVIHSSMSDLEFEGYLKGNIHRYLARFRYKNGVEDLRKADWYLQKLIMFVSRETKID